MSHLNLNFDYIDLLAEDDDDFKKEYVDTFKRTYEELIPKMKTTFNAKDLTTLGKAAHQLKPSAKMIGLPCADLIEEIQHHPEIAKAKDFEDFLQQFEEAYKSLTKWAEF